MPCGGHHILLRKQSIEIPRPIESTTKLFQFDFILRKFTLGLVQFGLVLDLPQIRQDLFGIGMTLFPDLADTLLVIADGSIIVSSPQSIIGQRDHLQ